MTLTILLRGRESKVSTGEVAHTVVVWLRCVVYISYCSYDTHICCAKWVRNDLRMWQKWRCFPFRFQTLSFKISACTVLVFISYQSPSSRPHSTQHGRIHSCVADEERPAGLAGLRSPPFRAQEGIQLVSCILTPLCLIHLTAWLIPGGV